MSEGYSFGNLAISRHIASAIKDMGFEEPSPIQAQAIPILMEGKDIIGQAQTGTGKTAAFGIPIVERINPRIRKVQALVVTPTRELAIQVAEEISKIGRYKGIKTLPIYGGQSIDRQIKALNYGVHIAIGTPGRLLDHLRRNTLKIDSTNIVVLDEADEMLDMGFVEDIQAILEYTPEEKQTLLFSATMPIEIIRLSRRYLKNPETIKVSKDEITAPLIEQVYYEVRENQKLDGLCRLFDCENITRSIIFCRTKRGVDELSSSLQARGYQVEGLHGDLSQMQRNKVMKMFKEGGVEHLIATDVAARGIDVDNVSHVINYDVPQDPESYVHRIGRTGRAGKTGIAVTFVTQREFRQLRLIEKIANTRITPRKIPSLNEVIEKQKETIRLRLIEAIEDNKLDTYREIVANLEAEYNAADIAAAALKLAIDLDINNEKDETEQVYDFGNTGARPGMVRLFMTIGRQDEVRPPDLITAISEQVDIPARSMGKINIFDKFSFVEVPENEAEKIMFTMDKSLINRKRIHVAPAKART